MARMVPFNDLRPQVHMLRDALRGAIDRVLDSGHFVLGHEVDAFERELADYVGVAYAIGVASGTDALELALRAAEIGPGDEVITPAHTAIATVCAIERAGARPVFAEIDPETMTLCPDSAEVAISSRTRAIVAVHLYGQAAALDKLSALAARRGLLLVEDAAQALGGTWRGRCLGSIGHLAALSFYPTKNLGALGDGGAVLTADEALAARVRALRFYGQPDRRDAQWHGLNSRLDEIQAAMLRVKLAALGDSIKQRRRLCLAYCEQLADCPGLRLPSDEQLAEHACHLFVVRHAQRDWLAAKLAARGIGTMIHYPVPVHLQTAYLSLGGGSGSLAHTETAAREVLSLPLFFGMRLEQVAEVASAVREVLSGVGV